MYLLIGVKEQEHCLGGRVHLLALDKVCSLVGEVLPEPVHQLLCILEALLGILSSTAMAVVNVIKSKYDMKFVSFDSLDCHVLESLVDVDRV